MQRLCVWMLALYPQGWRARYEAEMRALLEARSLSIAVAIDLLRGALDAHLHPAPIVVTPSQRMRGTVAATLSCWIALVLVGAGFAKATEDFPFRAAARAHALLGDARTLVVILAVAGSAVVALAGLPLAYAVLRQAWRERTRTLVRAICAAVLAVCLFAGAVGGLALLTGHSHGGTLLDHLLFAAFGGFAVLLAVVCALAARAGLMTARLEGGQLVLGVRGAWLLARIMAALTIAVALYAVLLVLDDASLAASPNGPFNLSTTVVLGSQVVGMVLSSALAAVTTRRGCRALLGS